MLHLSPFTREGKQNISSFGLQQGKIWYVLTNNSFTCMFRKECLNIHELPKAHTYTRNHKTIYVLLCKFLAPQYALEVMRFTEWVTELRIVSRLSWWLGEWGYWWPDDYDDHVDLDAHEVTDISRYIKACQASTIYGLPINLWYIYKRMWALIYILYILKAI